MHLDLSPKFNAYLSLLRDVHGENPARDDLASEAKERLAQLREISLQLKAIDDQFGTMVMITRVNEHGVEEHYNATHERDERLRFVMRLMTEAYYYFAFRLRQILRNRSHPFHGLSSFESPGVRNVRNHLIEHPEGSSSGIFNQTFSWSRESGMHLKSGRQAWEAAEFQDAGFVANSREYTQALEAAIDRACASLAESRGGSSA